MAGKIVLLDFDGVLADTLDDILRFAEIVCCNLGYPRTPTRADLNALDRMEFAELGRHLGLPREKIGDFVRGTFELFNQHDAPSQLIEGMDEVVVRLSATSKIGIVTGNVSSLVWRFLEHYKLKKHVTAVLGAGYAGSRSDKIRQAIQEIGRMAGEEVFMVGDAVSDIHAARATSVVSIAVGWGHQSPEKLALARPDYFAESPQDLLAILTKVDQGDL